VVSTLVISALVIGHWSLVIGHWSLVNSCSMLDGICN